MILISMMTKILLFIGAGVVVAFGLIYILFRIIVVKKFNNNNEKASLKKDIFNEAVVELSEGMTKEAVMDLFIGIPAVKESDDKISFSYLFTDKDGCKYGERCIITFNDNLVIDFKRYEVNVK